MLARILAALLALSTVSTAAAAQSCGTEDLIAQLSADDRARLDALVAEHPYPEGNFWQATKGDSTVMVLGTIHIPDPRLAGIIDDVQPFLEDEADIFIMEATSEDEARLASLAAEKPEMFFLTNGQSLIDLLGPEKWGEAKDKLEAIGIPGFVAAQFKPWYAAITLAIAPCAMQAIQSGEQGLDRQLERIALDDGVPIAALDDAEDVLRLFADEPLDAQLEGLIVALETQEDGAAATSTLVEAYFDGRTREAWEFSRIQVENAGIENGAEMFEEVNQTVLIGRNAQWEPKIVELVEGKDALLAVGAAHLSGESGVLRALERAGYQVSRVE